MTGHSWGGAYNNTSGFTGPPVYPYNDGVAFPSCRLAASGSRPARISGVSAGYVSTPANATPQIVNNGSTVGAGPTVIAATSTSMRFQLIPSGSFSFGRNTAVGPNTQWSDGDTPLTGVMPGSLTYQECPSAPQTPSATPGVTQATVNWAAPASDGGSAITGYRVYYSLNADMSSASFVDVGVVTSTVVTGLTNGVTYYFTVAAKNAVTTGASTTSVVTSTVSAFIASVPGAPTALALAALPGTISATWTAPASTGGSPILDYLLEWATDNLFTLNLGSAVVGLGRAKTVTDLSSGVTWYFRVKARNAVGLSAASSTVSTATTTKLALDSVEYASVVVSSGVQVSLRSDAATPPVISLGFSALTDGVTRTLIANLATNSGAGTFATPGGARDLELVADPAGNLFVIGRDAANPNAVLVKRYERTGTTNVWALDGSLSQALPSTGDALFSFAGVYVPASGVVSPKASIFLMTRRVGSVGVGALSWATLDLAAVEASAGSLFLGYGSDPTWLATPTSGEAANSGTLDLAALTNGSTRVVGRANGFFVVDVLNGAITGVSKAADGASGAGTKVRVVGVDASTFAILLVAAGALSVSFYGTNGALLGSATYAAANVQGGAFLRQWDAFFDRVTGQVRIYYVADDSARKIEFVDVSPTTFAISALTVATSTFGAASSTNPALRAVHAVVDERRILLEAANTLTGVQSTSSYSDTSGNVAPSAPALVTKAAFDATTATTFSWAFGDSNPADAQTAFQLQVQRVSDSVDVLDTGKVASATASRLVAGGTLTNAVPYRWRVRAYDGLDQVGAWSSYGTFTPSALGTLTITDPVSDNVAGIDTSSKSVVWTYVQANGYTQAKRRVRVVRTSDASVLLDTTLQANTVLNYTVAGMISDVEYRVELTIENTNGQQISVNRLITPSFSKPMTPTLTFDEGENYIDVIAANPEPSGSRPDVILNYVFRRETGDTDFVRIASIPKNGTYRDRAVRSGGAYDYKIQGVTA